MSLGALDMMVRGGNIGPKRIFYPSTTKKVASKNHALPLKGILGL